MLYHLFSFLLSTPANMRWKNKEIHFQLQKFYHYSLSKCSFMEMFLFEQSNSLQVIFEQSNNIKRFASIQINNLKLKQKNNWRNQKYPKEMSIKIKSQIWLSKSKSEMILKKKVYWKWGSWGSMFGCDKCTLYWRHFLDWSFNKKAATGTLPTNLCFKLAIINLKNKKIRKACNGHSLPTSLCYRS